MEWAGRRVLIIGKGRTGMAVCRRLLGLGAQPYLYDDLDFAPACAPQLTLQTWQQALPLDFAVVSPGVGRDHPLLVALGERGVPVLSELDLGYLLCPCPIIAVTGTNGKTTTVRLVEQLLARAGVPTGAFGNIGIPLVDATLPENGIAVVEISSFQLEQCKLFRCRYSAVTNVTTDHLERHKTWQAYWDCKAKLGRLTLDGYARNLDDEMLPRFDIPCYPYSLRQTQATAYVSDGCYRLRTPTGETPVVAVDKVPLWGTHNRYNVLCALTLAYAAVGYHPAFADALCAAKGEPMRMQRMWVGGRLVVNDSKSTNLSSVMAALSCVEEDVTLLLGGYDKGESFAPLFDALPHTVRRVILFGAVADRLFDEARAAGCEIAEKAADVAAASTKAWATPYALLFSPGCSSFDAYSSYLERGRDFEESILALAR